MGIGEMTLSSRIAEQANLERVPEDVAVPAKTFRYRMEDRPACWLTGVVGSGPHANGGEWVRELWARFLGRADELPEGLDRSVFVSPCHGRETEFTCYLGYAGESPVPASDLPDGFVSILIPAHRYGVATVSGDQADVTAVYGDLPRWIEGQGATTDREILWLELYRERPRPIGERIDLEIWLPLR